MQQGVLGAVGDWRALSNQLHVRSSPGCQQLEGQERGRQERARVKTKGLGQDDGAAWSRRGPLVGMRGDWPTRWLLPQAGGPRAIRASPSRAGRGVWR